MAHAGAQESLWVAKLSENTGALAKHKPTAIHRTAHAIVKAHF
jgi:hypothetical protein